MTLEEFTAFFAKIEPVVSVVASVAFSVASIYVAIVVHRWQRVYEKNKFLNSFFKTLQENNRLILENEELIEIEAAIQAHGATLDAKDIRKLYIYFNHLNVANIAFDAMQNEMMESSTCIAILDDVCDVLKNDMSFVRTYALKRGFSGEFVEYIENRWSK